MTGISVTVSSPYLNQITLVYPVELSDGSTSFYTFTGMLSQIGADATADFVLTGAPAGHEVTGSISGGGDVSAFPVTTFDGAMVICGDVEDNQLNLGW